MSITKKDIQQALRIKRAINEYFEYSLETKIMAKELMSLFISKEIFIKDYKEGLPIRDFLRQLEENNHLHLIPQAHFEQKDSNKNWYFIKTNK
jgi:hypothetical protein